MIKSLSIIIPFFNERKRINESLKKIKNFLHKNKTKIEIIFVNDGSEDSSLEILEKFLKRNNLIRSKFKIINLPDNLGKGGALKAGVVKCKNQWILTSDLDFSVDLEEIKIWIKKNYINNTCDIYFGSRELESSIVDSKFYRKFLGFFFRSFSRMFLGLNFRDTQCGFKLYKNNVAKKIFKKLRTEGFEHDLEIALIAKANNFNITELPVQWTHMPGSKLNILIDPFKMLLGIIKMSIKKFN